MNNRRAWTEDDRQRLEKLAATGHSAAEIGALLDRPRGSVCWHASRWNIRLSGGQGAKFVNKRTQGKWLTASGR